MIQWREGELGVVLQFTCKKNGVVFDLSAAGAALVLKTTAANETAPITRTTTIYSATGGITRYTLQNVVGPPVIDDREFKKGEYTGVLYYTDTSGKAFYSDAFDIRVVDPMTGKV